MLYPIQDIFSRPRSHVHHFVIAFNRRAVLRYSDRRLVRNLSVLHDVNLLVFFFRW